MALSIKNDEVERLARELARRRNVSITEAIRQSLEREVTREGGSQHKGDSALEAKLLAIAMEAAALPQISDQTEDEILGYDELGIPSR